MIKMQYIKLMELRGITEIPNGQSLFTVVENSGGEPSLEELAKVNEMVFLEAIKELDQLKAEVARLENVLEKNQDWLNALEEAGIDNWEGYDIAKELNNKQIGV